MKVYQYSGVKSQDIEIRLADHAGKTVDIAAFPAGTKILDARVTVDTAFTAGCTAALSLGSTAVVASASVASATELKNTRAHKVVRGNNKLTLTLGTATVGAGFVTVLYVLPTKTEVDY